VSQLKSISFIFYCFPRLSLDLSVKASLHGIAFARWVWWCIFVILNTEYNARGLRIREPQGLLLIQPWTILPAMQTGTGKAMAGHGSFTMICLLSVVFPGWLRAYPKMPLFELRFHCFTKLPATRGARLKLLILPTVRCTNVTLPFTRVFSRKNPCA
jgi:hypothetical protein